MDQQPALYDVYFTGKLIENISVDQAQQSVAVLFKTEPSKIAHIFNGQTHILKRNLSKEGALKYKTALRKAGLSILFKLSEDKDQATPPTPASQAKPETEKTVQNQAINPTVADDKPALSIAPVGSDVLTPNERKTVTPIDIDTSSIKLTSPFIDSQPEPTPNVQAPDTSHISVAEIGADIIADPQPDPPPLPLDIDDISLAPPGALLEGLHENLPELNPDTSAMSLAPVGADILDQPQNKPEPIAPDVSHISIEQP